MSTHRFFLAGSLPDGAFAGDPVTLPLSASDLHHAVKVARIRAGERIVVVDPTAIAFDVEVAAADREGVTGLVVAALPARPLPVVTLLLGMPKGGKADLVVEKATEIGVTRILPVVTARSVVRPEETAPKRVERWRRIAAAAAAQSQRTSIPVVEAPVGFEAALVAVASFDRCLVAWEESADPGIGGALAGAAANDSVAVLVGPEGGLTAEEVARLRDAGALTVSLGATILRAETAAIVAVALVSAALGGMGERRD
jgi:16S rRNA (uracil1498-N3)-methyltransferase